MTQVQQASYEDLSLFEQFSESKNTEKEGSQSDFEKDNIFFPDVNNHTYKLRAYPQIHTDETTGNPKLVLTRVIWNHGGFEKMRKLPCSGRDCPICKETKKLKDIKYADAFKYGSKKEAVMPVYIYEASTPKDSKWVKTNQYGFMVMRGKAYDSLTNFLAGLTPEEMKQVLNPKVEAPRITLSLTPGSGGSSSWGFDLRSAVLPELPEDFKSIYDVYIDESKKVTEDELKEVRMQVHKIVASNSGSLFQPDVEPAKTNMAEKKEQAASAVGDILGKKTEPAAESKVAESKPSGQEADPLCEGAANGLKFGANPQVLGGAPTVDCLSCSVESSPNGGCIAKTKELNNLK
jgi:hypothetical protein